jgi:aryl-alcohol dehydrogenase-like predicted oxidoreductase
VPEHQRRLGRTGIPVSPISLGTVELGMDYGIAAGGEKLRPDEAEAARLLDRALDLGINLIDTARTYGNSEEIIGRAIGSRRPEFYLVSKVSTFPSLSPEERRERMIGSVEESLRQLRTEWLDLLLLHTVPADNLGGGELADVLDGIRARGLTRFTGASVYGPEAALAALRSGRFDCLQIAWNLLDRRAEAEVIRLATDQNIGLMVRSVLMRGVLTHRYRFLPDSFAPVREAALQLMALADEGGMQLPELAYRYILSQPGPITALVGTGRIAELEQCVESARRGPLDDSLMAAVRQVKVEDESLLDLSRWPSF